MSSLMAQSVKNNDPLKPRKPSQKIPNPTTNSQLQTPWYGKLLSGSQNQGRKGNRNVHQVILRSRRPATGVSRALRARSVPGVSPRVSPKIGGVRRSVRRGVPGALRAADSGVSKKCPESVKKVSRTLRGHSRDTFWTPRRTLPRTPPISLLTFSSLN